MLQLARETEEALAKPSGGGPRGLPVRGRERADHGAGAREVPLEVLDRDRDVLDPVGEGSRRQGLAAGPREHGRRKRESPRSLLGRAPGRREPAGEAAHRVRREAVHASRAPEALLDLERRGRDLERERGRELARLELDVQARDEPLE
ncbi:MAG TPA: hypothetical protein VI540_03540, partial [Gaiellaceae bacterium]|nr:hypothetical protein [Gaiellaceae bacterium]